MIGNAFRGVALGRTAFQGLYEVLVRRARALISPEMMSSIL